MIELRNHDGIHEEKLCETALEWKKLLEQVNNYYEAVVIIDNVEEDINNYTIELLPRLMHEGRFTKLYVYSSKEECLRNVKKLYGEHVETHYYVRDFLKSFNYVQVLTNAYTRVYTNITEKLDDQNPFLIVGVNNITRREIVGRVFLGIKNYSETSEDVSFYSLPKERKEIDWEESSKYIPVDRKECGDQKSYLESRFCQLERNNFVQEGNKIVIYGKSKTADYLISFVKEKYKYILVDKSSSKIGRIIDGEEIKDPKKELCHHDTNIRIIVTIFHYQEVCEYLLYLGYELGKQVFIFNYKEDVLFIDKELLRLTINEELTRGRDVYLNIRNAFPEQEILLSPFDASGDIYLSSLYISEYVIREKISDYVVVVTSRAAQKISELCDYKTLLISMDDAYHLMNYARMVGFEHYGIHYINVGYSMQRICRVYNRIDINTLHQRLAFKDDMRRKTSVMRQKSSDSIFEDNCLKRGQTALIAPYSNTEGNISSDVCETIIEMLRNNNYDVCTNVAEDEKVLPGTKGLFIPYNQIIDFVNKAGLFIGVRSGLCDIISSTTSKMIVFYKAIDRNVYDLKEMGLKETNILQYNFEDVEEKGEQLYEQIEEFIQ